MNIPGLVELPCKDSVAVTVSRLESLMKAKGLKVFSRIDQAEEAKLVGLTMPPMVLLIIGNPKFGIPFMLQHPSTAIDLPIKALVWERADGKVLLTYNSPEFFQQRHRLSEPPFTAITDLLKSAA
jgi:uncharacterized protein (DUF302 family)